MIALPAGSTPMDFAYAVHTEVGHRTIGARVNGRLVPLDSTLENGDVVEVFTSKAEAPALPRLAGLRQESARATRSASGSRRSAARRRSRRQGRDRQGDAQAEPADPAPAVARALVAVATRCATPTSRRCTPRSARGRVGRARSCAAGAAWAASGGRGGTRRGRPARPARAPRSRTGDPGVVVKGVDDVWVKLAKCCTPVPGDDDHRVRDPWRGVSACTAPTAPTSTACAPQPERIVEVEWTPTRRRVPGEDPGRGARPQPAAVRRDPRAVGPPRQHPLGLGLDDADRVAISRFAFEMADRRTSPVLAAVRKSTASSTPTASRAPRPPRTRRSAPDLTGRACIARARCYSPLAVLKQGPAVRGALLHVETRRPARARSTGTASSGGSIRATSAPGALHGAWRAGWPTRDDIVGAQGSPRRRRGAGCGSVRRLAGAGRAPRRAPAGTGRCAPRRRVRRPTTPRAGTSGADATARSSGGCRSGRPRSRRPPTRAGRPRRAGARTRRRHRRRHD